MPLPHADQNGAVDEVARLALRTAADFDALETRDSLSLLPGRTIYEALQQAAKLKPNHPAIVQLETVEDLDPVRIDFATYLARAEQAANLFRSASRNAVPVVAVVAPYLSEALIAMWGGGIAGRYVPINPFLELEHVAGILNAAKATVLVIATTQHGQGVWSQLDKLNQSVPTLQRTYRISSDGAPDDFLTALALQPAGRLTFTPAQSSDEVCALMHTGGTTATPKLVCHTHGGQLLQAWLCGTAMGSETDAVIGHAMPNFHVGGAIAMGMRGIVFAQTLVTLTPAGFRNPKLIGEFWKIARRFGITSITTAPTTAAGLLTGEGEGSETLRQYTTGGGPLPPAVARQFEARFGVALREVWGGTEFHGILSMHYASPIAPRLGSCGRTVPFHKVISAILDGTRFVRIAGPEERGVLIASGPTTTPGYVDPSSDRSFFVEGGPDGRTWATTGDLGAVDADGFIWIYGREKDVIIRGGHNIDSALIDDVLVTHPSVLHAAAVGRPCPTRGELPMAYVQLRPGATATPDELLAFAREHIQERAAVPVELVILDAIPQTAVGKVSKPPLRIDALHRVATEVCEKTLDWPVHPEVEERGGKLTLVVRLPRGRASAAAKLTTAFAPFTFAIRIETETSQGD